jgi:glycine/D-amino acid oxidase-like deaminating enzyme
MASTEQPDHPALVGDHETDVAVVGGGIAGVCTAWELARLGVRVALLESRDIVAANTGHTTAKVTALHGMRYGKLRSSLGEQAADRYTRSQRDAVDHVVSTASELGVDCDLERRPAYSYVLSADLVDTVRDEVDAARAAGLDAELVTDSPLPYPIAAGVRLADQVQFHPRKYLLALAADLVRLGGRIYQSTRVTDLEEGRTCRLVTESGAKLAARHVVIATGWPVYDRISLFTRLTPRRELVLAAAIPDGQDPGGMYVTAEDGTRSVRTAPYRAGTRLLIITGEAFRPGTVNVSDRFSVLEQWTRKHFEVDSIGYRWAAQDYTTTDSVPYIGRFPGGEGRVWVATGFGAWGMSNGVMAGRLLSGLITGQPALPWTDLYDPHRLHLRVEAPGRDGSAEGGVGNLHPSGLHRGVQQRGAHLGLSLSRIPVLRGWFGVGRACTSSPEDPYSFGLIVRLWTLVQFSPSVLGRCACRDSRHIRSRRSYRSRHSRSRALG